MLGVKNWEVVIEEEGPGGASVAAIVMSSNQNNKVWQVAQLYKLHSKILVDQRCVSFPKLSTWIFCLYASSTV